MEAACEELVTEVAVRRQYHGKYSFSDENIVKLCEDQENITRPGCEERGTCL